MASFSEDCRPTVVGIRLFYCEGDQMKNLWVDLDSVHALAWCAGTIPERPGDKGGSNTPIPSTKDGPDPSKCQDQEGRRAMRPENGETPLCWWDGSQWVCGTE